MACKEATGCSEWVAASIRQRMVKQGQLMRLWTRGDGIARNALDEIVRAEKSRQEPPPKKPWNWSRLGPRRQAAALFKEIYGSGWREEENAVLLRTESK